MKKVFLSIGIVAALIWLIHVLENGKNKTV